MYYLMRYDFICAGTGMKFVCHIGSVLAFFLQWTVLVKNQSKQMFRKVDMHFSSRV
jgi:hypothetical protein